MFVRWERRPLTYRQRPGKKPPPTISLVARLVECRWINGKPRQRVIAYLCSIVETRIPHIMWRAHFHERCAAVLDRLGIVDIATGHAVVPPSERERIIAALCAKVPKPAVEEIAAELAVLDKQL